MKYPGGKNLEGVYQRIINQIPPHAYYVEPFAGSAAVFRMLRPCRRAVLIDSDPAAIAALRDAGVERPGLTLHTGCGIEWLDARRRQLPAGCFVYCDPPYLPETRTKKKVYACEMSEADHGRLLEVLCGLKCLVAISGYPSRMYREGLQGWRRIEYEVITRGATMRTECLWCNFPEPTELHDYRYWGADFRRRLDFRRLQNRWRTDLARWHPLKRRALFAHLRESFGAEMDGREE
jgi:DNA adenine methylase